MTDQVRLAADVWTAVKFHLALADSQANCFHYFAIAPLIQHCSLSQRELVGVVSLASWP